MNKIVRFGHFSVKYFIKIFILYDYFNEFCFYIFDIFIIIIDCIYLFLVVISSYYY